MRRVELTHWRGATCSHVIDFDVSKQVVLIYGENGTGKSSILDAIEYTLSGRAGSLEFLSLDGAGREKHLNTLGANPRKARAAVTIGNDVFKVTPGNRSFDRTPPKVFAIRRGALKQLTEADPSERYKVIAPCFEVDAVRKCEENLLVALRDYERRTTDANTQTATQLRELRSQHALTKPDGPVTDEVILEWAKQIAERDLSNDIIRRSILDRVIQKSSAFFMRARDLIAAWDALVVVRAERQALDEPSATPEAPSKFEQDLQRTLESAQAFVTEHHPHECPLCERPDDPRDRAKRLAERLIKLAKSRSINQRRQENQAKTATAETRWNSAVNQLLEAREDLLTDLIDSKDELLNALPPVAELEQPNPDVVGTLRMLVEQESTHVGRLEKTRHRVADRVTKIESLTKTLAAYHDYFEQSKSTATTAARLKEAAGLVGTMRKEFIQSQLHVISDDVARMYQFLHPGEPYTPGAMDLVEGRKGSLVHRARLGDLDTIPNATFSESHIDTLALCVHLALAKRLGGPQCVLLLDDVYHSVDHRHLDRLIDLIMEQSVHFGQVIMATHLLRAAKRFSMQHVGDGNVCHLSLLNKWSLETGLRWKNQPLEADVLRGILEADSFDRQTLASKTGVLMESVLDVLVCNYRCRVAKTPDGENTLAELRDGLMKVAKAFRRQSGVKQSAQWTQTEPDQELGPAWNAFGDHFNVRNDIGAHWKNVGQDYPDEVVESFARSALGVIEVVTCPYCHSLPRRREGSYWSCTCGRSRFTPLEAA